MAMRMWEIAKLLIIIELVLAFVPATGLFPTTYYAADQGAGTQYTIGNIKELHAGATVSVMDYVDMGIGFVMAGLNMLLTVLSVIFLIPQLTNTFHIPLPLAIIIQTVVYLELLYGL